MKKITQGFSLIELMVVIAVIGVLAGIALASYQEYTIRARLTEAHTILSQGQQLMEKKYANYRKYTCGENRSPQLNNQNTCQGSFNASFIYSPNADGTPTCPSTACTGDYCIYNRDDKDFSVNCSTHSALCGHTGSNLHQRYCLILQGRKEPFIGLTMTVDQQGNKTSKGSINGKSIPAAAQKCWVTNAKGTC